MTSSMQAAISSIANNMQKAVFFDRDGTLNVEVDYLYKIEDFQWTPDAVEAIKYCHARGYLVVVATNQSGIARGYYSEADMHRLHGWMNEQLAEVGTKIDAFYYCPHHPKGTVTKYAIECNCRKPKPGMLVRACQELHISQTDSYMVGDKMRDVESGEAAGMQGILYEGGSLLECIEKYI